MLEKKITFIAKDPNYFAIASRPFPAAQAVPQWWKDMPPYDPTPESPEGKKLRVRDAIPNYTFKKCVPMLDALTAGYIVPLWSDVIVEQNGSEEDGASIFWKNDHSLFKNHGYNSRHIEPPAGYTNQVVKFHNVWIPRTPKGYSILVTQPFGYKDSPFHAAPAIVDSDTSSLELIFPMWMKRGFEGVVERGTPLAQIIPFKRDNWVSEFTHYQDNEYLNIENSKFKATIVGHYLKNHWAKKTYK